VIDCEQLRTEGKGTSRCPSIFAQLVAKYLPSKAAVFAGGTASHTASVIHQLEPIVLIFPLCGVAGPAFFMQPLADRCGGCRSSGRALKSRGNCQHGKARIQDQPRVKNTTASAGLVSDMHHGHRGPARHESAAKRFTEENTGAPSSTAASVAARTGRTPLSRS